MYVFLKFSKCLSFDSIVKIRNYSHHEFLVFVGDNFPNAGNMETFHRMHSEMAFVAYSVKMRVQIYCFRGHLQKGWRKPRLSEKNHRWISKMEAWDNRTS